MVIHVLSHASLKIMMKIKIKTGFTLIEMILVVAIIGVMATITIAALDPLAQFQKANDSRRKSDLAQIQRALETYYQDAGRYPASTNNFLIINALNNTSCPSAPCNMAWGTSWQPYINILPKDPASPTKAYVYYSANGQGYCLYASLDRGSDPATCNKGAACPNRPSGATCGSGSGTVCNFGICSPNQSP